MIDHERKPPELEVIAGGKVEPDPDVLTADEVAVLLKVSRKLVYDSAGRGELPCRRLGRRFLFSRTAIMRWLGAQGHDTAGRKSDGGVP